MRVGLYGIGTGPLAGPEAITSFVTSAEELGFTTVWLYEHVLLLNSFASQYPFLDKEDESGLAVAMDMDFINPYIAGAFAAASTKKIRLATGVSIVPEYNPLLLSKLVASLDFLSGGRFALGIGMGWLKEEYDAMGVPWERRGARMDEYVEVMRETWSPGPSTFEGEFAQFKDVLCFPKPVNGSSLPILIGGNSDKASQRAARYGDGLYMYGMKPAEAKPLIELTRERLEANGRGDVPFEFAVAGRTSITPDDLPAYEEIGVNEVSLRAELIYKEGSVPEEIPEILARIAARWLDKS